MKSADLREAFLEFFTDRDHTRVSSAPLVPKADPTILFNVAGMVQFKPLWAGMVEPLPYKRATSVQKCLRLEDIDLVGTDATHDTFFEMLGNFSFGDYQKEDAIRWAWEFVTGVMALPKERLWVSVHQEDEEAAEIWRDVVGLPRKRVVYLGDEDNFWGPAGGKGACGPSSEIFWDLEWKKGDAGPGPAEDEARYTEIWNLVFPQFDQQEDGSRKPLKYRGVDTGAGLERMALAAQNVETIFHTDLFYPLMQAAADTLGVKISADTWEYLAISADHVRAATFVIGEGVRPSNKEQGYVIRRVLRRAIGALYLLGIRKPLLYRLSGDVTEQMRRVYPELEKRREQVALMIKGEEERFLKTLEEGMRLFTDAAKAGEISGPDAFKLHDTHGFPIDLTKWLARHKDVKVDMEGFEKAMEGQREKSRRSVTIDQGTMATGTGGTIKDEFKGYDHNSTDTNILYINPPDKEGKVLLALEKSPFYAEAGGQVADTGKIIGEDFEIEVLGVEYNNSGDRITLGEFIKGKYSKDLKGAKVHAVVDISRRMEIERAHTATHLLHAALRKILGEHVKQEGSLVEPGRLRFDFYHPSPMSPEEIRLVEKQVYEWVISDLEAKAGEMSRKEAEKLGALAFFAEKYGDVVRVLQIRESDTGELISAELCGGTHLDRTGKIGLFKITSETGVAAGIRRIEACVGEKAFGEIGRISDTLTELSESLNVVQDKLLKRVEELKFKLSTIEKERDQLAQKFVNSQVNDILSRAQKIDGVEFVTAKIKGITRNDMRLLADSLKSKRKFIVGVITSPEKEERLAILVFVPDSLVNRYNAPDLLKGIAMNFKGSGGGRASMAEGWISETSLEKLTSVFIEVVKSIMGNE
ncbi:alanine--tRNA ligase [candidate division WOR-3 bacterium]|uniref:Alanine--tRNA ligase n=1 Tax=candidate division WOR-3 bacterium TaxID=2052148 RepID=A0A9D5K8G2_UNCW3|nr:alanine--tRNA ligase [candidate division WOR-3 bacterium]MBD3364014.1 alanine--tRNA ligase [candidate division WOR-3 bacterium]